MFSDGLVEEVQSVLSRGFNLGAKAFEALGYVQVARVLRGEVGLLEAVTLTKRDTRRYAKRQLTWFRQEKDCVWYHSTGADPQLHASVKMAVATFLKQPDLKFASADFTTRR